MTATRRSLWGMAAGLVCAPLVARASQGSAEPVESLSWPEIDQKRLNDLFAPIVAEFEKDFVVHEHEFVSPGSHNSFCETGDEYVEICSGGMLLEGDHTGFFRQPEWAMRNWLRHIRDYSSGKNELYWRIRPEIDGRIYKSLWHMDGPLAPPSILDEPFYAVYSRLFMK